MTITINNATTAKLKTEMQWRKLNCFFYGFDVSVATVSSMPYSEIASLLDVRNAD
jgi:hypothetical protein